MMFAGNPGVLAAGVGGKTYDEFVAHITQLSSGRERAWSASFAPDFPASSYTTTAAPISGVMYGSPWGLAGSGRTGASVSSVCRVMQHGLPSETSFQNQISAGRRVFYRTSALAVHDMFSVNRNGYLSIGGEPSRESAQVTEILYWDNGPLRMRPHLGLGPEPYDWI